MDKEFLKMYKKANRNVKVPCSIVVPNKKKILINKYKDIETKQEIVEYASNGEED